MDRMIIDVTHGGIALHDPRTFSDLHVAVHGDVDLQEALTIAGAGRMDGDDAFVSTRWVRNAISDLGLDDEEWQTGFEAMLGFARSQGWIADDGNGIRAHVVRGA